MSIRPNRVLGWLAAVALALAAAQTYAPAQGITIPNSFTNATIADAPQVNANFAALAANALNRNGGTMNGNLLFTDATFDIGASGATRPRDLFLSRNAVIGGTLGAGGATTLSSTLNVTGLTTLGASTGGWTVITSTATGTQNDFAPGLVGHTVLRMNNATAVTITGFAGGVDGQRLTVVSIGAGDVIFSHQVTSTAANQLFNVATSGGTRLKAGLGSATYLYDGTTLRWRLIQHEQGGPITAAFAAGDFVGTTQPWTVGAGDVLTSQFYLKGRQLTYAFYLGSTTVTAGATALNIAAAQWGGYASNLTTLNPIIYNDNGAGNTGGFVAVAPAGAAVSIQKLTGTFGAATDATGVFGEIVFEVQ